MQDHSAGEEDLSSDEEESVGVSWSWPFHLSPSRKNQGDLKDFQVCRTAIFLLLPQLRGRCMVAAVQCCSVL